MNKEAYDAEIAEECKICSGHGHINKDGLCPFCQLDIDLNFYEKN